MSVLIVFIFGLIIGSFLGAVAYRAPLDIPISKGRSFCPHCKKIINWYDNIPLFSYLILGGKCRSCGAKISIREPLIELSTAVLFVLDFLYLDLNLFFAFFISALLVLIFVIDLEHQLVFDEHVFLGLLISIVFYVFSGEGGLYLHLSAGFGAALFLLLINLATLGRGMGLGDVKLALFLGFILGPLLSVIWMGLAFVIGAVVGIILILFKKAHFGEKIPFGPFLVIAFLIVLFFGDRLIQFWYVY